MAGHLPPREVRAILEGERRVVDFSALLKVPLVLTADTSWDALLGDVLGSLGRASESVLREQAGDAKAELLARIRRDAFTVVDGDQAIPDESRRA